MKRINLILLIFGLINLFLNCDVNAQLFWNQGATFAGSNSSYFAVRHSSSLNITGSFTLEAWVNPTNSLSPANQIILQKRLNTGPDGYTLYLNSGKVAVRTASTTRLVGNISVPSNKWTHVAATYNSASSLFSVFVNGVLDSTVIIAGAAPISNSDSIWIGKGSNSPFAGMMDEIRIWNTARTNLSDFLYTSLSSNQANLVFSLTFQDNESLGNFFSLTDWSENTNISYNRGVAIADFSDRPLPTIQMNDCAEFFGNDEYMAAPDNAAVSPIWRITFSAWIYPRSENGIIIHKGSPANPGFTSYELHLFYRIPIVAINSNYSFYADYSVPLNSWTHICFTYDGATKKYQFFINGQFNYSDTVNAGSISNGSDSLYIGGPYNNFNGFIDEVHIFPEVKTAEEISQLVFMSADEGNSGIGDYAVYNLDGYTESNNGAGPKLYFRNGSNFAHVGGFSGQPQSPMCRADDLNFQNGYFLKATDNRRIPVSGNSGSMTTDTLKLLHNVTISDINVFVGLNHNRVKDLEIFLVAPNGNSVQLFDNTELIGYGAHLTTIFNDQADSSLINGRYISFSPRIKPFQNLNSVFAGQTSGGSWKLVINDNNNNSSNDTGRLYGWGIQVNNEATKSYQLDVTNLIQGFYDPAANTMIPDTMRFYLRTFLTPYTILDSSKVMLSTDGLASVFFANAAAGENYYLQLYHRNSIQTWSKTAITYNPLTFQAEYNFTTAANKAFGNNMIQVDAAPVKFAVYSGDPNHDDIVDASDLIMIYNDVTAGASGYVITDITGDQITDVTDLILAYNNLNAGVEAIYP